MVANGYEDRRVHATFRANLKTIVAGWRLACSIRAAYSNLTFALVVIATCLLAFAVSYPASANSPAVQPPNIVVIMTDDQDDMGSMDTMPFVQKYLVQKGVRFTNSFVDDSLCCPSRTSLLTGQSVHNHGVWVSYVQFVHRENNNLGVWLQRVGYTTALMGKFLNGYGEKSDPTHLIPGWNKWDAIVGKQRYFNYSLNENGAVKNYGFSDEDYLTDVLTRKGVAFISEQAQLHRPFFLLLTPIAPHNNGAMPPTPARRHAGYFDNLSFVKSPNFNEADVSDKPGFISALPILGPSAVTESINHFRKRRESLLAVDEMVRAIMQALIINNMNNTYVILTSDNGWSHGSHRWQSKIVTYEESIRVPLVMRGPGIPVGQVRTQLVTNLDLAATIIALTGATPGNVIDGRNLMPVLTDASVPWRSAFVIHGMFRLNNSRPIDFERLTAIRSKNYIFSTLSSRQYGKEMEFYDLEIDRYQLVNRARDAKYATVVNFLRQALSSLSVCAGSSCWMTTVPPPLRN